MKGPQQSSTVSRWLSSDLLIARPWLRDCETGRIWLGIRVYIIPQRLRVYPVCPSGCQPTHMLLSVYTGESWSRNPWLTALSRVNMQHIHTYIHEATQTDRQINTHARAHTHTHTHTHLYIYIYVWVCVWYYSITFSDSSLSILSVPTLRLKDTQSRNHTIHPELLLTVWVILWNKVAWVLAT